MSVSYLITFQVRPTERERFLALLNGVLDAMRGETTFRSAAFHADPGDPCRFLLLESWADHEDVVEVQLARPYREAWHAALPELLERPRDIGVWTPLRQDVAAAGVLAG
ncbi:putative quinol monooxygenase [Mangrovicella endophytica]|uniref:putative quinol monooxygenase n=1 Tax=Mangrovicella endophytica TaxID=2066697 RepID=UPI000C9EC47E|nr:putative quinol monooxygenase [Mangrovicella endophytica]